MALRGSRGRDRHCRLICPQVSLTCGIAKSYAEPGSASDGAYGPGVGGVQMTSNSSARSDVESSSDEQIAGPPMTALPSRERNYHGNGREIIAVLAVSGVIVSSWALFPSAGQSATYVSLPELSPPGASAINPGGRDREVGMPPIALSRNDIDVYANTILVAGKPQFRYVSSVIDVSEIPIRSKLEALLRILYAQMDGLDAAELGAKIEALLKLPDSVLVQLLQHPDLVDLNVVLDSVFYGTSGVGDIKTQLDKVDVATVSGAGDQVQVVKVSEQVAFTVRTPTADESVTTSIVAAESVPAVAEAMMTVAVRFDELAGVIVSTFTTAAPPPPAPMPAAPMTMLAQVEFAPVPVAPVSVDIAPPPPTTQPAEATHAPTPTVEPTQQAFDDASIAREQFESDETVPQRNVGSSSTSSSPEAPETRSVQPAGDDSPNGDGGDADSASDGTSGSGGSGDGDSGAGNGSDGSSGGDGGGDV